MENENWLNSTTYQRRFTRNSDVSAYRFLDPFIWDPLYGEIFWGDAIETDPIYQACMVIFRARELWGAYELTYIQDLVEAGKKDEADREQQRRQLARTIFNCYEPARSVVDETVMRDDGRVFQRYTLRSKAEDAIDIVDGHLRAANYEDEIPESDILIVLAIAEAHEALCLIYLEERPEDEHEVLELIHDADLLLHRAEQLKSLPYTEIGIKIKKQFQSVQDAHKGKAESEHAEWLRIAKEVKAKRLRRTVRGIALLVHDQVKDPYTLKPKLDTIYRFLLSQKNNM